MTSTSTSTPTGPTAAPPATTPGQAPATARLPWRTAWPLYVGMAVAGSAAVVASAATLAALARAAGWGTGHGWVTYTPWLLPACLDVGGCVGGWVWLRPGAPPRAAHFGRSVALIGAAGTLVGNAAGHLIGSGYLHPSPVLVVVVGAVPAAVLVALAHLAALLATGTSTTTSETGTGTQTASAAAQQPDRPSARPTQPRPAPVAQEPTEHPDPPFEDVLAGTRPPIRLVTATHGRPAPDRTTAARPRAQVDDEQLLAVIRPLVAAGAGRPRIEAALTDQNLPCGSARLRTLITQAKDEHAALADEPAAEQQ